MSVKAGSRGRTDLFVGRLSGGYNLTIPLHVVNGQEDGPTLLIVAAIHGEEIYATEAIRQVINRFDPAKLKGTLLLVPVGNPLSLEQQTRNTPFDMLNMNRVFPGKADGWISERLAAALSEVIPHANTIIHIDGGSVERLIHYIYLKESDNEWGRQVYELSRIFGLEVAYRGPFFEGSLTAYAASLGIPCIVPEIGGSLLLTDPKYMRETLQGITNVMAHLGMVNENIVLPENQTVVTRRTLIRIPNGGIYVPNVGLKELNVPLAKGTLLGSVVDPYSLQVTEEIFAPYEQSIIFQMRALLSAVQPGDYAYIIGDGTSAEPMVQR